MFYVRSVRVPVMYRYGARGRKDRDERIDAVEKMVCGPANVVTITAVISNVHVVCRSRYVTRNYRFANGWKNHVTQRPRRGGRRRVEEGNTIRGKEKNNNATVGRQCRIRT